MTTDARDRVRDRVLAEIQLGPAAVPTRAPGRSPRVAVATGLISALVAAGGVTVAAQEALPGDALYGLKKVTESVRVAVAADQVEVGRLELRLARERLEEIVAASERGSASPVQITGLDIRLGALIELGLPGELRDGLDEAIDALNETLLAPVGDELCEVFDALSLPCSNEETQLLELENPLELDVPLVDLDLVQATAEVVQDGESVTATATSSLAGLNLLGVACVGQESSSTGNQRVDQPLRGGPVGAVR